MKTPERFNRALKALVQAFFNDELAKGDCRKCAVGNMCGGSQWATVFVTEHYSRPQMMDLSNYTGEAKEEIDSTGYTVLELAKIERAFEKATKLDGSIFGVYKKSTKEEIIHDQFNGLMAVVEVLCEIDNIEPTEYKKAFEYTADFKPVYETVL